MPIVTTLAGCNVNPALNGPDGSTDLPSTLDDQCRYLASFIAQLRDGVATGGGALWMTGMIAQFPTASTPVGWLKLNGQFVSRTTYANLFAFASASGLVSEVDWANYGWGNFSVGDGSTIFRLPDLRGMHTRGADEGRGMDPARAVKSFQDQAVISHAHGVNDPGHTHGGVTDSQGVHSHGVNDPGHAHLFGINDVNAGLAGSGGPRLGGNAIATSTSGTGISIQNSVAHAHNLLINGALTGLSTQSAGGAQNLVKNIAYPFYVKY